MKKLLSVAAALLATANAALAADRYEVTIREPTATANERAVVQVGVSPASGWRVDTGYPLKLTITPPDGVTLEQKKQTQSDATRFERGGIELDVAFTASGRGTKTFTGQLKFAVCTDTECRPAVEPVVFEVEVR